MSFSHVTFMYTHAGSMIPFMLRLLDAELPQYCREPTLALDRLYMLKESCEKVENGTFML